MSSIKYAMCSAVAIPGQLVGWKENWGAVNFFLFIFFLGGQFFQPSHLLTPSPGQLKFEVLFLAQYSVIFNSLLLYKNSGDPFLLNSLILPP